MKRIGLALGGGGVRGLAHALVLELLDELGIRPSMISGTSMGAIIGALYASGNSGREIREAIRRHTISKSDKWKDVFEKKDDLLKWFGALSLEMGRGGLIGTDRFLDYLFEQLRKSTFEELDIPLKVIATDFWHAEEVVIETGDLLPALKASMAVPGVFAPVLIDGRVLIDGGTTNVVPYDHVMHGCDVTIAVDVGGTRVPNKNRIPGIVEAILGTFDIMQEAILAGKLSSQKPDIYIKPDIHNIRMLEFNRADEVFAQAQPAIIKLRQQLERKLLEV